MKISTEIDFTAKNLLKRKEIAILFSEKLNSTIICQAFQPKRVGKSKSFGNLKIFFSSKMGLKFKADLWN